MQIKKLKQVFCCVFLLGIFASTITHAMCPLPWWMKERDERNEHMTEEEKMSKLEYQLYNLKNRYWKLWIRDPLEASRLDYKLCGLESGIESLKDEWNEGLYRIISKYR
ncbi:hypothetical protein AGMMS49936_07010 [Endomicrobiia bacterium]|nr:hypothetical protein AGMMS49936_07010 [Endomicrobiia bacterium]